MHAESVVEINENTLQALLAQSYELPVLFYFWSEHDPENTKQSALITSLAQAYQGKFILAKLNCDQHPMLAAQFGLQMLPTFYVFKNGQPVDGLQGPQTEESLRTLLQGVLPDDNEITLNQARQYMDEGEYDKAIVLLKTLHKEWRDEGGLPRPEVSLLLTNGLLKLKQIEEACTVLNTIAKTDRNAEYQELLDHIELLKKAANSPEIDRLHTQFSAYPENAKYRIALALKLQDVGRHEEALSLLFEPLETDLNAGKGSIRQTLLDMLNTLGTANPLTTQYRRKLYTLMY